MSPDLAATEAICAAIVALYVALRVREDARDFGRHFALLAVAAWVAEDTMIRAHGFYVYSPRWHLFVDKVPLLIVLIWPVVIHSAQSAARFLVGERRALVPVATAAIVLADASLIEPLAVHADLWRWTAPGLFAVPPIGILGWSVFALAASFLVEKRAHALLLVTLPALLSHAALVALWWAFFRWTSAPLPSLPSIIAAWAVMLAAAAVAATQRWRVPRRELLLRLPGALFFLGVLAVFPSLILTIYALAFVPVYLVLLARRSDDGIA